MNNREKIIKFMNEAELIEGRELKSQLLQKIELERGRKMKISFDSLLSSINKGFYEEAALDFVLITKPYEFIDLIEQLRKKFDSFFSSSDTAFKINLILFLISVTLNLKSSLTFWSLANVDLYSSRALTEKEINKQINKNLTFLKNWGEEHKNIQKQVLEYLTSITKERLKSEDVNEDQIVDAAQSIIGENIEYYMNQMFISIERSNIRKIGSSGNNKDLLTDIGNDYAAHLIEAMRLGASFVTTNPLIIYTNYCRNLDISDLQIDAIIRTFIIDKKINNKTDLTQELVEELTDIFTAEIVINNAKLLRNIFLLTNGNKGCVCLQVNPIYHGNSDKMIEQILRIYSYLKNKLGGIPNVIFKLPGTKAGLETQKVLTGIGIVTNITVEFGLFQIISFAKAINLNNIIVSFLTVMNGRLAGPVYEELKSLGIHNAKEAAQWAGVAVAKKAFDLLYSKDKLAFVASKTRLLIASLRNYDNFFPDITELIGIPVISVFPNIRNQFDDITLDIDPKAIERPVNKSILETLSKSEIFKQAYYLPGDPDEYKPKSILSIDNIEAVQNWIPIKATLDAFIHSRKQTENGLQDRIITMVNSQQNSNL